MIKRRAPACSIRKQGHPRKPQAAVVGGVLAERELALHMQVVHSDEAVVFVHPTIRALLEALCVIGRPPILKIALRIELAALVVEAVRELVADDAADVAKICRHRMRFVVEAAAGECRQGN